MRHGDISNERLPAIGIRFEEIIRRSKDGKLNRTGKAFAERMALYDIDIVFFTTENSRKAAGYCYKWGIPYTRVCSVDSILELIQASIEQQLLQYWDTDKDILSKINERHRGTEVMFWTLEGNSFLE